MDTARTPPLSDRSFYAINAAVSAVALGLLTWLLVLRSGDPDTRALAFMPAVNACMNAVSASCMIAGFVAIRTRRVALHRALMSTAFGASAVFLVGYLAYHYVHGDTHYAGTGALKVVYLVLLASHVLLSMAVLPLVFAAFWFALTNQIPKHKKVVKWTLPIWLYVSVTGVVVYVLLRSSY